MMWGSLSDRFGRKPVLLLGPLGLSFSMLFFGTSTTYLPLVVSRFCQGLFNGCVGGCIAYFYLWDQIFYRSYRSVSKYDSRGTFLTPTNFSSVLKFNSKMTDASNIGDAVAFEPLMWSVGSTIA